MRSAQLCELLPRSEGAVSIAHREADLYELLVEARELCEQHNGRFHLLVRAQHDRQLEDHASRLWEHLAQQPAQVCWQIEMPAPKGKFESEKSGTIGKPLGIAQAVRWIAQLGGHRRSPSSPAPGADTLWRGLARLQDMILGWLLASQFNKCG